MIQAPGAGSMHACARITTEYHNSAISLTQDKADQDLQIPPKRRPVSFADNRYSDLGCKPNRCAVWGDDGRLPPARWPGRVRSAHHALQSPVAAWLLEGDPDLEETLLRSILCDFDGSEFNTS